MQSKEKVMTEDELKLALHKAFDLGSKYWQQADSEYSSQWKKADATRAQLDQLIEDNAKQARSAQVQEPLTWYEGAPPFPQDQEWFIAETIYGDKVVLRSLDEGREHKGNYAFKTADQTYMKQEIVKRWMQFPDCEYLPPAAQRQWVGLTDEEEVELWESTDSDWELMKRTEAKLKEKNT